MRFNCVCNNEFDLPIKEAKLISREFDLFCSPSCFLRYINEHESIKISAKRYRPVVSTAFECWDKVTYRFYRSMYEVYVARYLILNNINFYYEPHAFKINGKYYTPDFWVPEKDLYIECKGRWGSGSKAKTENAAKIFPLILLPSYLQQEFKKEMKQC